MNKNLLAKIIVIIAIPIFAGRTLYPPEKTLRSGIDLAGGVSLIYQIDVEGIKPQDRKDLSKRMISVLRRRIDPTNIQNIEWWPQGDIRFEIRMPLASPETREKRQKFDQALNSLLDENIKQAKILRALKRPKEERAEIFEKEAHGSTQKLETLNKLAESYDQYQQLQSRSDELSQKLDETEKQITDAGLATSEIKAKAYDWSKLNEQKLTEELKIFIGADPNAVSDSRFELLSNYVKTFSEFAQVTEELTKAGTGKADEYREAKKALDNLTLTKEQIMYILEIPKKTERENTINKLKEEFSDRVEKIVAVVEAFEDYRDYQGLLDDPNDFQNMLKGAGILEFRVLPTIGYPDVDIEKMQSYVDRLKTKGPRFASDDEYTWLEVEDSKDWIGTDKEQRTYVRVTDDKGNPAIVASFGNKYYVLASNSEDDCLLHNPEKPWKLIKASSGRDRQGRRAIDFVLDDRAGRRFAKITDKNMFRPLCIILDDLAISAPVIQIRISTEGQIQGKFSREAVESMVRKLEAGHLPAQLIEQPISVKLIGPSLGAENRDQGIKAGMIGLVCVIVCMAIYYTLAGSIADVALLLNILFILAMMVILRATFTLPGIAGIILTIGMSVDANVLIFERIREEQQKGSSLSISIKNGYQRAFRTIFDANLTTFLTAAILYWVASEEIKGFAIVLMLGIVSSMFTALFLTRVMFDFIFFFKPTRHTMKSMIFVTWPVWVFLIFLWRGSLPFLPWRVSFPFLPFGFWVNLFLSSVLAGFLVAVVITLLVHILGFAVVSARQLRIIKEHLFMLQLIRKPNVNWMKLRPVFFTISGILILTGLFIFFTTENKYDIEFTGGTSAVINLKDEVELTRSQVEEKIRKVGQEWGNPALATTNVYSIGKPTKETPSGEKTYKQYEIKTIETNKTSVRVAFTKSEQQTVEIIASAIGNQLSNVTVKPLSNPNVFEINTSQTNKTIVRNVIKAAFPEAEISEPEVEETVNKAILTAFEKDLEIRQSLHPNISSAEKITEEVTDAYPELTDFLSGLKITCTIDRPVLIEEINSRFEALIYKPEMSELKRYPNQLLRTDLTPIEASEPVDKFVYASVNEDFAFRQASADEWNDYVDNEKKKISAAMQLSEPLQGLTQISASVGSEAKTRALIAIILSLAAIVAYIWIRFGNVRYGLAAISALVHDVCITLGTVTVCTFIANTKIGQVLLISDFKINLAIIAAFLTLIGYSLNDTIVVFDRIRENRRKAQLTSQTITNSINQTLSRTILTSFTTFVVVLIMYIFGGEALRGFTFAIGFGVIIGTYSSIAIAAPILLFGRRLISANRQKQTRKDI